MIYNSSFFNKELKEGYVENSTSRKSQIAFGVFLGLISFAVYFFLLTVERSVIGDVAPQLLYSSYFSTLYILINITIVCYAVYLVVYYEYLSFVEIVRNRWYTLVKMGYSTAEMILIKILGRILSIGMIYTIGFIMTILLTAFLKFPFIVEYIPSLYIAGFIDLIILTVITMVISISIKNSNTARYGIIISLFSLIFIKWSTGFTDIIANRDLMKNVINLFDINQSYFIIIALLVIWAALTIGIVRAKNIAKYYNFPYYNHEIGLEENTEIVILDEEGGEFKKSKEYGERKENKSVNIFCATVLTIVLGLSIFVNGIILLISLSSGQTEVTIFGHIPYIFLSETMEPTIMYNDLAFFKKVDRQEEVKVNDIVIYDLQGKDNVEIARVKKVEKDRYTVDIDKYPENAKEKQKLTTIDRKVIYGVYEGRSRWLGALILFANSTIGRLMFLILPAILIFFYKEINKFFNEIFKGRLKN